MPLTNEEFSRLDAARINSMHLRKTAGDGPKRILQIAFEHIEEITGQQLRAIKLVEQLVNERNKSLCFRVPAFFAVQWARVKGWFSKGRTGLGTD